MDDGRFIQGISRFGLTLAVLLFSCSFLEQYIPKRSISFEAVSPLENLTIQKGIKEKYGLTDTTEVDLLNKFNSILSYSPPVNADFHDWNGRMNYFSSLFKEIKELPISNTSKKRLFIQIGDKHLDLYVELKKVCVDSVNFSSFDPNNSFALLDKAKKAYLSGSLSKLSPKFKGLMGYIALEKSFKN